MRRQINATDAQLPNAIPAAQRPLPGELVYRFRDWARDAWAGHRDARLMRAMLANDRTIEPTAWMVGLAAGLATAVQRERRDATSLQAPLRKAAIALVERHAAMREGRQALVDAIEAAAEAKSPAGATTAGELHDTEEQRRARRAREHRARVEATQGALRQHEAQFAGLAAELAQLREEFDFHEAVYLRRVEALRNFYIKRQAVYARHALHHATADGRAPVLPELTAPELAADSFPMLQPAAVGANPGGERP